MQIAYGSLMRVIQKLDSLKYLAGSEVSDSCDPVYELEFLPLHTYLRLRTTNPRIILKSPNVKQESLVSYNTPEEATLFIKDGNSELTLFSLSFLVTITPAVCKDLQIVHTDTYNIDGSVFEDMEIQI